ncbi:MAG: histidine triad nucleotide-binding protein [Chloroflexota bacterium]|nr:histidine triad nucleotide-binding protein [Chloroflexota bacterium]
MAESCLFCRIVSGEIPAQEVYRNDRVLAFRDIVPVAPTHVLVIPVSHVENLEELTDPALAGALLLATAEVARREGLEESGYRVVLNTGRDAGQSVDHVHAHVLGGRNMQWPPG